MTVIEPPDISHSRVAVQGRKPPLTKTNESTLFVYAPKNGSVFGLGF
jgi:hypothetical protein